MYCNSCIKKIPVDKITRCAQCNVPLCKDCANHCQICGKELCDSCYAENNYKCEECYKPDDMFQVIRRSHIEQYAGCPYSLYLQLVLGIEPPMGKHAQLGVIVHELIDKSSEYDFGLSAAIGELEDRVEEWNLKTDDDYSIITMDLLDVGKTCLMNFFGIKDSFGKDFISEHNIKFSLGKNIPQVSCTLDRIEFDKESGKIYIHDWKTGKPMSGKKLITDLQPPLYMYAVCQEYGQMPESFTLHYLNPNKHIVYHRIDDNTYFVKTTRNVYELDIKDAIKRTKEILNGIKNNKFSMPDDSTHSWRCNNMCWFGLTDRCKGVQNQQWQEINNQRKKNQ